MISQWIVRKFIKDFENKSDFKVKAQYGYIEGLISVYLNVFLFIINLLAGIISGSIALMTDSFHTLSDVLGSVAIMIASRISSLPEDKKHPFGHGRSDLVATIFVAILLGVAGLEFLKSSIERIWNPQPITANWLVIGVVLLTIILKEWNARFSLYLGKQIQSEMLIASAHHHRSDAYSSLAVLLVVVGDFFSFPILDGIIGVILSIFLVFTAFQIGKKTSSDLLGNAPDSKDLATITEMAKKVEGVEGVHDIIVHNYGNKKVISLHLEINHSTSFEDAHNISEAVEKIILEQTGYFPTTHIDPVNYQDPQLNDIRSYLEQLIPQAPFKIQKFHDLRLIKKNKKNFLFFDLLVDSHLETNEKKLLSDFFSEALKKQFDFIDAIQIQYEPLFSY